MDMCVCADLTIKIFSSEIKHFGHMNSTDYWLSVGVLEPAAATCNSALISLKGEWRESRAGVEVAVGGYLLP